MARVRLERALGLFLALLSTGAIATPPFPTLNVMLQFTCISLAPPGSAEATIGDLRPPPSLRSEREIGGNQAHHEIALSQNRHFDIDEKLVTTEECSRLPQNTVSWALRANGTRTAEFCITANPGLIDSNVVVQIAMPALRDDYERRVASALESIASCRVERGPYRFFPGDRLTIGRQIFVPNVEDQAATAQ